MCGLYSKTSRNIKKKKNHLVQEFELFFFYKLYFLVRSRIGSNSRQQIQVSSLAPLGWTGRSGD